MMMQCLIRKATNNDIGALRELYLALEEDGVRYQPEHFVIGERTTEFFQTIFDSDNQDILVADIDVKYNNRHQVCAVATFAAVQEWQFIRSRKA